MTEDVEAEPEFFDDQEETMAAVHRALNELADVKAYTLTPDELHDIKAAQYALRNVSDTIDGKPVTSVYDE